MSEWLVNHLLYDEACVRPDGLDDLLARGAHVGSDAEAQAYMSDVEAYYTSAREALRCGLRDFG